MCQGSCVTCQASYFFFLQNGEANWWRVCYQRGLPRLVFTSMRFIIHLNLLVLPTEILPILEEQIFHKALLQEGFQCFGRVFDWLQLVV